MKAAYRTEYGAPEVLEVRELPIPEPRANEVRLKVAYTSVNRTDSEVVMGNFWLFRLFTGLRRPKYPVPGTDVCGIVDKIGAAVTGFKVGDRVVGLNDNSHPTQAEYSVWPEKSSLCKIPKEVAFKDIIACAEGGYYALNFINKVNMKAGDRVLVNGGTGAIGSSAIQILKQMGCGVVSTARTEHLELVHSLGAEKVFDYTKEDFTRTDDRFDFIFDSVGKSRFKYCKRIMKPGGVYISSELGPKAENIWLSLAGLFSKKERVKFPAPSNPTENLDKLIALIAKESLKGVVDREYPIEEIQDAYKYVISGQKVGAVLLALDVEL